MAKGFQEDKEKALSDLNKQFDAINARLSSGIFIILIVIIVSIIILKMLGWAM